MILTAEVSQIKLKNILCLTDFSKCSMAALPFVVAISRKYNAMVHALHVLTPVIPESCVDAIAADKNLAEAEMETIHSKLSGVAHRTTVVQGMQIWPAVEQTIKSDDTDLIVLGTHGRTGATKLVLGSIAEEIFRRSSVPVLTIGPDAGERAQPDGLFRSILFATDLSHHSPAGPLYAASLAKENEARLILLHVVRKRTAAGNGATEPALSVAEAFHQLYDLIPANELSSTPEIAVKVGQPANEIIKAAKESGADLIILGLRDATKHMIAATHLDRPTAHKVIAHAVCPVLTVRH